MLKKSLKKFFDILFVILVVVGLSACGGGGGSAPIVEQANTPPPPPAPTYSPPGWNGISFYDSDPNGDQWIEATYRRLTQDERDDVDFTSKNYNFERTNFGLLYHYNTGHVDPIEDEHEPSSGSNEWGISMTDQTAVGDFNGDGLDDVMFAHRYDPNKSTWKANAPAILLINQGNGRLEVEPCVYKNCNIPTSNEMYFPHVADFNMDGIDDFITIGADPLILMSGNEGIENYTDEFNEALLEAKTGSEDSLGSVWTHTTAIGDLDNNGTLDIYIPFHIRDRYEDCASSVPGCSNFIMLGDGRGNFTLGSVDFPFTGNVWGSIIGDFDNDGYGDILVSLDNIQSDHIFYNDKHWGTSSAMIMFGNADGDYKRDIVYLDESMLGEHFIGLEFHLNDIDSDGDLDIISIQTGDHEGVGYYRDNQIQVFENKGNRKFEDISNTFVDRSKEDELPAFPSTGLLHPSYYQLVDLDGDGDLDLWPKSGQYHTPYYIRDYNKFILAGTAGTVLEYLGTENNCEPSCANTFYLGLAVDIDNDGFKDFLQTHVNNGWIVSQLMVLYNIF